MRHARHKDKSAVHSTGCLSLPSTCVRIFIYFFLLLLLLHLLSSHFCIYIFFFYFLRNHSNPVATVARRLTKPVIKIMQRLVIFIAQFFSNPPPEDRERKHVMSRVEGARNFLIVLSCNALSYNVCNRGVKP